MKTRKMGGLASALTVNPGLAAAQLNSSARIVVQVPFEFVVAKRDRPRRYVFLAIGRKEQDPRQQNYLSAAGKQVGS